MESDHTSYHSKLQRILAGRGLDSDTEEASQEDMGSLGSLKVVRIMLTQRMHWHMNRKAEPVLSCLRMMRGRGILRDLKSWCDVLIKCS